jgi:hypothetical protein
MAKRERAMVVSYVRVERGSEERMAEREKERKSEREREEGLIDEGRRNDVGRLYLWQNRLDDGLFARK